MQFRTLLILIFTFITHNSFSQVIALSGTVIDSITREPLAFVNIITDNSGQGTVTSIDGNFRFNLNSPPEKLVFSYVGYLQKTFELTEVANLNRLIVELSPKAYDLNEVYIFPGENPAHRIIKLVSENRRNNNPERISSFSYLSYDKIIFTVDLDSLAEPKKQKNRRRMVQDISEYPEEDYSDTNARKIIEKHHLMLMESISTRRFMYPDKEKEEIIASRVSGFKKPSFILMARQFQSFSFYGDFISISEKKYLNPISPGSTDKYFFLLEDTMFTERKDTIFIISFRPKRGKNFNGLSGVLYINSYKWAVQNVIAEAYEQQNELISMKIQQKYDLVDDYWFPVQLNTNMIFNNVVAETNTRKMKVIGIGKSYLLNIRINPELERKDFDNVYIDVNRHAHQMPEEYWQRYRVDTLSAKERVTYRIVDSIGILKNFDRTFNNLETIMTGYLPGRFFNLDIRSIIDYNSYEGWRLGMGGFTSKNVSEFFALGGHFAYGLRDQAWKYGISLSFNIYSKHQINLKLCYLDDLEEAGDYKFLENIKPLSSESFRKYMIKNMDLVTRTQAGLSWRMLKYLNTNFFVRTSITRPSTLYMYSVTTESPKLMINEFNFTEFGIKTRYAFNEGFMKTPGGNTFSLGTKYPVFYLNITKGVRFLNGTFDFFRIESGISKTFVLRRFGDSKIVFNGGVVRGKVPYSRLYAGNGSFNGFNVETENSFATMRFNEFLSDRFISLYYKHNFGRLLFRTSKFKPEIAVVNNIGFGWLSNREYHNNIDYKTLEKGFFESGLLFNNLITRKMFGYGVGLFYRYGPYSFARIGENFAVKLTLTINL